MRCTATALALVAGASVAHAGLSAAPPVPFSETFDTDNAGWSGPGGVGQPAGFAGGALVETVDVGTFTSFPGSPAFGTLFRAELGASGSAFEGDYLASSITGLSFEISASAPMAFFVRLAGASNANGLTTATSPLVFPGPGSTSVDLSLDLADLSLSGPPGTTAASVFSDIQRVQILAVGVPGVSPTSGDVTFTLDSFSIVPAPGAGAVLGLAGLAALRRRR